MERKIKNVQTFFFFLIIGSLILSACVKNTSEITPFSPSDEVQNSVNETRQPEETQPVAQNLDPTNESFINVDLNLLDGTRVDFMYPWVGNVDLSLQALINEFNNKNEWGVFVNGIAVGGVEPMFDVLNEQVPDGKMTDLILLYPYLIKRLDDDNYWTNLSAYINDPIWGLGSEGLLDIPEAYVNQYQEGDNIYGLPIALSAEGLFYNKTWAQELGFTHAPTTPGELKEQLCKAGASKLSDGDIDNNGTGGLFLSRTPLSIISWYQAFGGLIPEGLEIVQFNNQATYDAFTYIKTLFDESCAWVGRQPTPYEYFADRLALVYEGKVEDIMLQTDAFSRSGAKDEWIMIPYPTLNGEGSIVVDAFSLAIPVAKPEIQLAAWLFTRWLSSNDAQVIFSQASGTWPIHTSTMISMGEFQNSFPQWDDLIPFPTLVFSGPSYSGWKVEKMVLEDAYWRYLQGDASALPEILEILDQTILELSEK